MKSADQARGELEQRLVARVAAQLREYGHRLPVETSSAAVADQWSAHLAGPMAPAELLEIEYLNQFVSSGGSTEEIMPKTTEDRWLARRSGSRALSDAQITASRRGGRRVSRQVALDSQHADEEATSATLSVRSHDPAFEIDEDAIAARPASMVVRQATEEEGISQDDLTVLSTKLKRILEEEARRHGIDV